MHITRYEPPYRPLDLLSRLIQEDDFGNLLRTSAEGASGINWNPAVDIREEDERFVLQADLPGVNPEDIEVAMADGVLTIRGERSAETTDEKEGYRRYERARGSFLRRFSLPDTANGDDISAATRHGVLEVTIPKQAKPQPRKIAVQAG